MGEGHLEGPQIPGCRAQCHSKVGCGVFRAAVSPGAAGMGWGPGEQRGPRGWAAGTESSCQVRRAAPSSTWRRSGGSRRLRRPLSNRHYCSGFDSSGVRVRLPPSPAKRAHQAAVRSPRGLGSRQAQDVEPVLNPSAAALRTRPSSRELPTHQDPARLRVQRKREVTAPPSSTLKSLAAAGRRSQCARAAAPGVCSCT